MKKIFTLLSLVAIVVAGQAKADFICWDGSFGYNAAGFFNKGSRYELTFQGVQMGELSFEFLNHFVAISGDSYSAKIHVAFDKDECKQNPESNEWACEKFARSIDPNVFIEYGVDDLTRTASVISGTQVDRITALITRGGALAVTFHDKTKSGETRVQRVTFDIPMCDRLSWGSMDGTRFPLRLIQYFEQR